jgi:hypothetical protein
MDRRRVLPAPVFAAWLSVFLPDLVAGGPPQLLTPAMVTAAWNIAATLPADDGRRPTLLAAAEQHAKAGLSGVGSGDYMGDHWLGSFALYMLGCAPGD